MTENETHQQQLTNEKWKRELRLYQQEWSKDKKERDGGSSQVKAPFGSGSGSPTVIAEAIRLEVLQKVFSNQPGKEEVSRHIANVVTPIVYHWGEQSAVTYHDFLVQNPTWSKNWHETKRDQLFFKAKYGDLWDRAAALVKARIDARLARRKAEHETYREAQRLREMSALRARLAARSAGRGTGRAEGGQELPQEGAAEGKG